MSHPAKTSRKPSRSTDLQLHRYLLDAVEQAVVATDPVGTVIFMNKYAEKLYGWKEKDALGRPIMDVIPSEMPREESRQHVLRMGKGERFAGERVLRRRDGTTFDASVTTYPILDRTEQQVGIIGLSRDITEYKEAERRREAQYAVTRTLAESATIAEAIPEVLATVGRELDCSLGVLWTVDLDAEVLRAVEVWRASPDRLRVFEDLTRRMVFPQGLELCGRVWEENEVLWTSNLLKTLSPPRALLARNEGLETALGFPIRTKRGVFGIVTFYGRAIPDPDDDMRSMLHAIGSQIGLFTDRREAERLENSLDQLRALSRRLVAVREEERTRASREFHDELGQSLTGLKLDLAWVGRQLAAQDKRPANVEERLREMSGQVDSVIQTVKQVITELRPRVLDELGLVAAIEWLTGDFRRRAGMPCELVVDIPDLELDETRRTAVFRILQEILTNVARHARATEVRVSLGRDNEQLVLNVRDNGRGITEAELSAHTSLGLLGMQERANACSGTIALRGAPGAGTTVTVRIPLDHRPG